MTTDPLDTDNQDQIAKFHLWAGRALYAGRKWKLAIDGIIDTIQQGEISKEDRSKVDSYSRQWDEANARAIRLYELLERKGEV